MGRQVGLDLFVHKIEFYHEKFIFVSQNFLSVNKINFCPKLFNVINKIQPIKSYLAFSLCVGNLFLIFKFKIHFCWDKIKFCIQNSILWRQNSILRTKFTIVMIKPLLSTKFTFVNLMDSPPNVIGDWTVVFVNKINFCHDKIHFCRHHQIQSVSSVCMLVTDWLKHLHGEDISNLFCLIIINHLLNIYVNITVMMVYMPL
jgi:hypothetical protein